ncbi:hypothetical protein HMI54_012017, partial [Coelomomyces lativittatus]
MEQEAKQLVSQESTQSLERKPQEGSGNNIPIEHKVQSYGQTGRQFQVPNFDDLPSPTQQEQATRGAPMDWFSSNRLNPFVLPVYEGGSFHAYVEKFLRIVKRYEHLTEEDRVGFFFERLDPNTQMLVRHSPHYRTKANLQELIKTIKRLLGQERESESIYELFNIYCQEVWEGKRTLEQLGIGCLELYKATPSIPVESIECLISPIADVLDDELYYKIIVPEEDDDVTLQGVLNRLIKIGGKKAPKVYGYRRANAGMQRLHRS